MRCGRLWSRAAILCTRSVSDAVWELEPVDEGLSLRFGAKVPGHEFRVRKASMDFSYAAGYDEEQPEAYERVILDALVGDPTLPTDQRTPARWFNTAAFAAANQFTIGSASRNPVRGPSYKDVDLAVMRRVGLGGERAIELRLEVFNLLNTANFGAPAAQFGPASFGTITTALDPRVVQLAGKFWF